MTEVNSSAVYVRNAMKHYGPKSGPRHKQVLNGLNMTVERGSIYGLLGASGCGKTTLLSCIVGRRKFNSGELWVLGGTPGTEGSGVPGPRIGYMPQETALVGEFSLRGVVSYFGRIVGMSQDVIQSRWDELKELLDLPPDDRRVSQCSGGQQRRVSLAAALIHDPELLILDEPTVGVDPVLREKIWEYLVEITVKKNISVIITTHYIEECRQAHKIGLMRQGKLMAEEAPSALITRYNAATLEEVFLNLSLKQADGHMNNDPDADDNTVVDRIDNIASVNESISNISVVQEHRSTDMLTDTKKTKVKSRSTFEINPQRLKALFYKNWYQYFTNYSGVAFMIIFPLLHMTIFFLAIGGDPINIPIAFVNEENGTCDNFNMKDSLTFLNETDCEFQQLSCRYIRETDDPMINKVFYTDFSKAFNDAKKGIVIGVVYFTKNFTESAKERIESGRFASNATMDYSEIKVWMDMSNRQVGQIIESKLYKKYIDFSKRMIKDCNRNPKLGEVPVKFNDAIYGSEDYTFTFFMVPGLIITVIYFLAAMMTSTIIITDRLEGVWDRTLVAGATAAELLTAHITIQLLMIIIQSIEVILVTFAIFKADYRGTMANIIGLVLSQGIAGMCYGFMVSAFCNSHMMANFVATGSFYPMLLISGVIWPIEAMPNILWFISRLMPFTTPIEALRSIMAKGWSISNLKIMESYGITSCWVLIYIIFTFYLLKSKM